MSKIIALFPGQGSQKVGMGRDLFETSEIAKHYFSEADKILGFALSKLCFEGPQENLTSTAIAQPAILTVSCICFELFHELSMCPGRVEVLAGLGHSLGEYSALVASGAISFHDAVSLVHKRGSYMQEAVPLGVGKMAAILGREVGEIEAALSQITGGVVQVANVNAPGQVVIAGDALAVEEALRALGGKSIELPVSAPFHCSLMKPAEENLWKDLQTTAFNNGTFPVYSNFSTEPLRSPDEIRLALRQQVCGRVRWVEGIERAIRETGASQVAEFGAGNVLAGLMKRINPTISRITIDSAEAATAAAG